MVDKWGRNKRRKLFNLHEADDADHGVEILNFAPR